MIDSQTILFGSNQTNGIVSIEARDSEVDLYIRHGTKLTKAALPFSPWMLITNKDDAPPSTGLMELNGNDYKYKVIFPSWEAFNTALNKMRSEKVDLFAYPTPEKQFLVSTGRTLFKGMAFDDIVRMQLDIETDGLVYNNGNGKILMISISDNRGHEETIIADEAEILHRMVEIINERDPDVIEGHNIFGFDLPFISARAKHLGIPITIGRDGSELSFGGRRNCTIGAYTRPFTQAHIYGRHIIDTLLTVQRYDVSRGWLESYGLKECARAYGISEQDRVYISGDEIFDTWQKDPEKVRIYGLQDVLETRSLAELICPPEFYMAQMVPDTYQNSATSGNGEKINSILIREYLRQEHAIPHPQPNRSIKGGYTELRITGLIRHVVKCDVESLYPSIMLSKGIKPASDVLDVFLPALSELTKRRIEAKRNAKQGNEPGRSYWDGLQSSFKILINSFYGYLGAPFHFNDYDAAESITSEGQRIVKQIAKSIERLGGRVIEVDTDGVYFQAPDRVISEDDEHAFIQEVGRHLPEGINLAHDGRYAAMVSLKVKNYVLVGYDGHKTFKGSTIRSRADEPFGRDFIARAVDFLVSGKNEEAGKLYSSLMNQIIEGKLPVEQFARRERITEKTFNSSQKKRVSAIAQGVAVGDYILLYERNNGELGPISEYNNDENKAYLMDKLYKFACRLKECFGNEFDSLFPKPTPNSTRMAEIAGQQHFDIFDDI